MKTRKGKKVKKQVTNIIHVVIDVHVNDQTNNNQ